MFNFLEFFYNLIIDIFEFITAIIVLSYSGIFNLSAAKDQFTVPHVPPI